MTNASPYVVRKKMIKEILEQFDFEKCQKVMTLLNWYWYGIGVPTIERMKESAENRLENAADGVLNRERRVNSNTPFSVSSGGFKATAYKNRYGYLDFLKLEFIVSEWETDNDM